MSQIAQHWLQLINDARAQSRYCGEMFCEIAPPLLWNERLALAAEEHCRDMAENNFFDHIGGDGWPVGERATRNGYVWSRVAENISFGHLPVEEVIVGWLGSPGHCGNIMALEYTDMGMACVCDDKAPASNYWTLVLARPLSSS
ncbi:CAP domain-containing protein [Hahella sp. CR1]|uniref:CAP domain-containing protein n=1 Tax=Hahella sp. CR1 TaxID=2992807 RepID=UPI0024430A19|nr:CAP domain-containing protein [Hahella sp. CR1]MDG9671345.1 CAP domain-containing protein [Hahella sp. CR1]